LVYLCHVDTEGVYDHHIEDFQEDVELCLEEAMDSYEVAIEHDSRKWNSKLKKSDVETISMKKRLKELRETAEVELLKQFEMDFKMQLLDLVTMQIGKRQKKILEPPVLVQ